MHLLNIKIHIEKSVTPEREPDFEKKERIVRFSGLSIIATLLFMASFFSILEIYLHTKAEHNDSYEKNLNSLNFAEYLLEAIFFAIIAGTMIYLFHKLSSMFK